MSKYVIWNVTKQAYVARAGLQSSFTKALNKARTFPSMDSAQAECCGNEFPRNVLDEMEG